MSPSLRLLWLMSRSISLTWLLCQSLRLVHLILQWQVDSRQCNPKNQRPSAPAFIRNFRYAHTFFLTQPARNTVGSKQAAIAIFEVGLRHRRGTGQQTMQQEAEQVFLQLTKIAKNIEKQKASAD